MTLETANFIYKSSAMVAIVLSLLLVILAVLSFWSGQIRDKYSENKISQLGVELDREVQKHSPRFLTDEQKNILITGLKGKLTKVNILIQRDAEAKGLHLIL